MSVRIDDLDLIIRREEADQSLIHEIRTINRVATRARRRLAEHRVAGISGSILKDVGRPALQIALEGEIMGETARESLTALKTKYESGEALPFASDLTGLAQVEKVLIERLDVVAAAGRPNSYRYEMILREYVEPPPPPEAAPSQDAEAEEQAEQESEVDDIRGKIVDAGGDPLKGVSVIVTGPAGEHRVKTTEDGGYEVLDVPEGDYEIAVDAEEFEELKTEVKVKKGGEAASGA